MNTRMTTDLDVIKNHPHRFVWGKIVQIHTLGRYTFVEYREYRYTRGTQGDGSEGEISFHIYVDGRSTSHSASTLDSALIEAIALANQPDQNHAIWMARAAKMLLLQPPKE